VKVGEIIEEAEKLSRERYDPDEWIGWINACLDDLTPVARVLASTEVALYAGQVECALPQDLHEIVSVEFRSASGSRFLRQRSWDDSVLVGYKRKNGVIRLQGVSPVAGDVLAVAYYKKLAHVDDLEDIPEIPEEWHHLIVLYCVARALQREEWQAERAAVQQEYAAKRQEFAAQRALAMDPAARRLLAESTQQPKGA